MCQSDATDRCAFGITFLLLDLPPQPAPAQARRFGELQEFRHLQTLRGARGTRYGRRFLERLRVTTGSAAIKDCVYFIVLGFQRIRLTSQMKMFIPNFRSLEDAVRAQSAKGCGGGFLR